MRRVRDRETEPRGRAETVPASAVAGGGSRQRKRDAILLLRGEDLETVSRALCVTADTLFSRQEAFLAAGEASLASRPANGEELESGRLKARLGEMLLERECSPWPAASGKSVR